MKSRTVKQLRIGTTRHCDCFGGAPFAAPSFFYMKGPMNLRSMKYAVALTLAVGAAVISACSDTAPTQPVRSSRPHFNVDPGTPGQKLVLCKEGASGTFNVVLSPNALGSLLVTSPVTLAAGQCVDVWVGRQDGLGPCCEPFDGVQITETSAIPVSIRVEAAPDQNCFVQAQTANFVDVVMFTYAGCKVTFVNTPPPPPPGEGCTPGFWKNSVGSWPAGYLPNADFDATFGVNGFNPNITLMTALGLGSGGKNALARHAVAALLNAASGDVDYPMTTAAVIAHVQAGFASGDFEGAKNPLEALNESGCGLANDNSF